MTPRSLDHITLACGAHEDADDGLCVMEAVAFMAEESHSDAPQCACPVLSSFLRRLNDRLPNAERQSLKVLIPSLIGSRNPAAEETRRWRLVDAAVRVWAPWWLERARLTVQADALRALPVVTRETAVSARSAASAAADAADAASFAAYAAAADYAAYAASAAAAAASAASAAADAAISAFWAANGADVIALVRELCEVTA